MRKGTVRGNGSAQKIEFDTSTLAVPEQVSVAMDEIAPDMREGLLAIPVGGRRVPIRRPRARSVDGSGEVPVPAYELFSATEVMTKMAMQRMLAEVSTRRYPVALQPVGEQVKKALHTCGGAEMLILSSPPPIRSIRSL